jgi:hypothetical protein
MTRNTVPVPEFSRPVAADQIGPRDTEREIAANEAERGRLAERFGLLALDRLAATLRLNRGDGGLIHVHGWLEADVVQTCVVTLEPVRSQIRESFAVAFGAGRSAPDGEVVVIDVDEKDPAEELTDGRIDLGEVVAQQLSVALDPYPRAPGAHDRFEAAEGESGATPGASPFAALERLRPRRN